MLSFSIYYMTLAEFEALRQQFRRQEINPLHYQNELARRLVVSGFDSGTAEYIVGLQQQGKADTASIQPNAWTRHLAVKAALLYDKLTECVNHVEREFLRDIRKVNKLLLKQLASEPGQELAVVLMEEN
ncbi:hypothetical protein [Neisseria iguanae]|uniref:Uncharacterized protein n=1 Tax=Neisseria iguanae TaxID=90242 RepID=A0A2P7TYR6_9NEIS|nr:hypothetical protein [Neisseria iguanae]PSJ79872.1 hypothetical protein C7N83_09580 [Neisseria iguanae]